MKKRLISLITAVTVIFTSALWGCDDKNKQNSATEENAVTEEIIFRECSTADAQKISVPVTINRDDSPVELKEAELPDFMSLMPEEFSYLTQFGEDYSEPEAEVATVLHMGGVFYINVIYSCFGTTEHNIDEWYQEYAVFAFQPESGKTELVFNGYSEEKIDFSTELHRFNITAAGGKLYISYEETTGDNDENCRSVLLEYNPQDGSYKEIFNEPTESWRLTLHSSENNLLMCHMDADENYNTRYTYKNYDCETGQWETIEQVIPSASDHISYTYTDGGLVKTVYDDENNAILEIEREGYYCISLDEKTGKLGTNFHSTEEGIMWAEYKSVYYTSNDYIFNKYDVEENMIYTVDVGSLGLSSTLFYKSGDAVVLTSNSLVHYFIPELGLVYPLVDIGQYTGFCLNDGVFSFVGYKEASYEADWETGVPKTDGPMYLFWFENNA